MEGDSVMISVQNINNDVDVDNVHENKHCFRDDDGPELYKRQQSGLIFYFSNYGGVAVC